MEYLENPWSDNSRKESRDDMRGIAWKNSERNLWSKFLRNPWRIPIVNIGRHPLRNTGKIPGGIPGGISSRIPGEESQEECRDEPEKKFRIRYLIESPKIPWVIYDIVPGGTLSGILGKIPRSISTAISGEISEEEVIRAEFMEKSRMNMGTNLWKNLKGNPWRNLVQKKTKKSRINPCKIRWRHFGTTPGGIPEWILGGILMAIPVGLLEKISKGIPKWISDGIPGENPGHRLEYSERNPYRKPWRIKSLGIPGKPRHERFGSKSWE